MKTHKVGFSDPAFMHELSSRGGLNYFFLIEITIFSHVTHWADCASNISHDESSLRWCHPPKTNIEAAEDSTARELRGVCIDEAGAASPVYKLTTLTDI